MLIGQLLISNADYHMTENTYASINSDVDSGGSHISTNYPRKKRLDEMNPFKPLLLEFIPADYGM